MKYYFLAFLPCLLFSTVAQSQGVLGGRKSIDIPFEYVNNFIILNVIFSEKLPLKFIFDTGAEHTILTKKEYAAASNLNYEREFKIVGADLTTEITAFLARRVPFKIGNLLFPKVDVLVFQEDYFQFEELTGVEVDGIIGANIFGRYVVSINYRKQILTLTNADRFNPPGEKYSSLPISVYRGKPYIAAKSKLNNLNPAIELKLLIDTGAGLSLLLYTDTHKSIKIPPNVIKGNIGMGLGGYLEGFLGRVQELEIANLKLNNIITNFQEIYTLIDTSFLNARNGIVGNLILERFEIIINYPKQRLYLKPNKKFKKEFEYDRSGIVMIATGKNLNVIVVNDVIPGSPADEAGVKKGDVIRSVNWIPSGYPTMKDLIRIFQKKPGKKIKLTIRRNGEKVKLQFRLRDLI